MRLLRVIWHTMRILTHIARVHPDQMKMFHDVERMRIMAEECPGCRKRLPVQVGGELYRYE